MNAFRLKKTDRSLSWFWRKYSFQGFLDKNWIKHQEASPMSVFYLCHETWPLLWKNSSFAILLCVFGSRKATNCFEPWHETIFFLLSSMILRRPQNFAKSTPIIWLAVHGTRLVEISQNFVAFSIYMNFIRPQSHGYILTLGSNSLWNRISIWFQKRFEIITKGQ